MEIEQLPNESKSAAYIRFVLVTDCGATFEPTHQVHFFSNLFKENADDQRRVFFLDSLYCALMAPEKKVALRAYIQACEYSYDRRYSNLRYASESAFHEAKMRIEKFLEG